LTLSIIVLSIAGLSINESGAYYQTRCVLSRSALRKANKTLHLREKFTFPHQRTIVPFAESLEVAAVLSGVSMSSMGPELVTQISDALKDACQTVERLSGQPVNPLTRDVIARRIMRCVDSGETDPGKWRDFALGGFAENRQEDRAA
jgi:hypothetical protein